MALNDEVIRLLLGHALGVVTRHHGLWQTLGIFCIGKAQMIDRVGALGFKHPAIGRIAIGADALTAFIQIENFSGKSVGSIRQDFFAKQVAHNLTALLAAGAQAQVNARFQAREQQYKITTFRHYWNDALKTSGRAVQIDGSCAGSVICTRICSSRLTRRVDDGFILFGFNRLGLNLMALSLTPMLHPIDKCPPARHPAR